MSAVTPQGCSFGRLSGVRARSQRRSNGKDTKSVRTTANSGVYFGLFSKSPLTIFGSFWLFLTYNWSFSTRMIIRSIIRLCDGSYIRLKNIEVAYTFTQPWIRKAGVKDLKVFVSANNLWVWTRMPDDRESNFSSWGGAVGAYPTMKRINFGVRFNL